MTPLVSVLIPAYNAAGTIRRAIDSALAQDYPNFEIIVVDDGSQDETSEVVAEYRDPRLRHLRLSRNQGEGGVLNQAIPLARGEYVAFLDADDEWLPRKLTKQIAALEANPKASMATCLLRFVDAAGRCMVEAGAAPKGVGKGDIWRAMLAATCIAKPCVVTRTALLRQVGPFNTAIPVAADQDMWIRLALLGDVEIVPEFLTIAHDTPGSLTKVHARRTHRYVLPMIRGHIRAAGARLTRREIRHILGVRYSALGRNLYVTGNLLRGSLLLARALVLGARRGEDLWYLVTASPPARLAKHLLRRPRAAPPPRPRAPGLNSDFPMLAPAPTALAPLRDPRPVLIVTVDTEAEFDWSAPFQRSLTNVRNVGRQVAAQAIFDRFGVRPIYLVDYAVATQREAYQTLRGILRDGRCEIGAHLQPWETPPFSEELGERTSFTSKLPAWLQKEKLASLTTAIEANLGVRPLAYRAGRYSVGEETAGILQSLEYTIDLSVVPGIDLRRRHGPDFRRAFNQPYWFGPNAGLLEIPLTAGFTGMLATARPREGIDTRLHGLLTGPTATRLHAAGIFARLGLLDRITLTPEGITIEEMQRLTRALLKRGNRVFTLSYHSSSLLPGGSPYVRTEEDVAAFLAKIEAYVRFFLHDLGGVATTPTDLRASLEREAMPGGPKQWGHSARAKLPSASSVASEPDRRGGDSPKALEPGMTPCAASPAFST